MPILRTTLLAMLVLSGACSGGTDYGNPPPPPPPGPPPPPPPAPGPTLAVSVNEGTFAPQNGSVQSGGKVTWTWNGTSAHNVTFEDDQNNSTTKVTGMHERTFGTVTSSMTFRYRCTEHSLNFISGMHGQIVVTP